MTMRTCARIAAWLLALLALAGALPSGAAITDSSGSPRTTHVTGPFGNVTRNLQWRVQTDTSLPFVVPPNFTATVLENQIASSGASFVIDKGGMTTLGTLAPLEAMPGPIASFSEKVTLPPALLERARREGARRILVVRSFEQTFRVRFTGIVMQQQQSFVLDFSDTGTEAVAFYLSPSVGGPLSVFRAVLRFDDHAPFKMVRENEPVRVYADLYYRGSGLLQGVWEVADAMSTSGQPVFRPLERVVRQLLAGDRLTLRGPALPSRIHGLYLVRFRVLGPFPVIEDPIVRYQVLAGGGPGPFHPITVASPRPESRVDPATSFAWSEVPGAVVYRVEFFEDRRGSPHLYLDDSYETFADATAPERIPPPFEAATLGEMRADEAGRGARVTGLLLPANERETVISELAWEALVPGRRYWWRVVAVSENGTVIGTSQLQRAHVELPPAP